MGNTMKYDYYYGIEAEQFSFYRIGVGFCGLISNLEL